MEGIIIIDKPLGMTSHDVVKEVRKKFKMRRVGHAGTLDPLATGVLVILLGKCTKLFNQFVQFDKAYQATLLLGTVTDSADIHGKVLKKSCYDHITGGQINAAFQRFEGEIEQIPPMVSAIKFKGRKLYQLARKGIEVERSPRKILIKELRLKKIDIPEVDFYLECSKGTYVRQLAADIGDVLGCGACISKIQRTRVGSFPLKDAVSLEALDESHIRSWKI